MENKTQDRQKVATMKQISWGSAIWMFITTLVVFIPNISPWIATPFVLIGLILVIGYLLSINLRVKTNDTSEDILYSIGLGLGFLLIGGLFINWALPYFGILHPLGRLPLMIFFDLFTIILSLRAYLFNKDRVFLFTPKLPNAENLFFGLIPWVFVLLSVWGAETLNNGGSGTVTLVMLFAIALYFLAVMLRRHRIDGWVYISALYATSLSLLLMYSLRSNHIFGWDINLEYQVFQMTLQNLRWKMSYYPGLDYNACVSVTILPTIFKVLTNTASEYVFKVTFQLIFAITPVIVYVFAKRYLENALAFLAAFLVISQTWFYEQMPALIRQEIAFIFFGILLLVLFDAKLSKLIRYILFYTFTADLILSHYSTAYVWLALLLVILILSYGSRYFVRSLRAQPKIIETRMLVALLIVLGVWQIFLTNTIHQAANFVTTVNQVTVATSSAAILQSSGSSTGIAPALSTTTVGVVPVIKNAIMTTLFVGGTINTDQNIQAAQAQAVLGDMKQAGYPTYSSSMTASYIPIAVNESTNLIPLLPRDISLGVDFLARASKIVFIDLFPIVGIVGLYLALRRRPSEGNYDFILLGIGALALIVLIILIPNIQIYYNFTRLYLQMFMILSTFAVIGGVIVLKYLPRYQIVVLALMAAIIFCSLSGAFDQVTGGQTSMILDQPPSNLDAPYIYDGEVASARWLGANRDNSDLVQADIVAVLRLQSFENLTIDNHAIFPQTLEPESYVYLTKENIGGEGFFEYNNNLLVYNYPVDFLNEHKNLIYNNGDSRIYR